MESFWEAIKTPAPSFGLRLSQAGLEKLPTDDDDALLKNW